MRKQLIDPSLPLATRRPGELELDRLATVLYTSESPDHPIDHAFDLRRGPGGSRWVAAVPGEQTIVVAFDQPQRLRHVEVEVEEPSESRTQELELSVSEDGGTSYRSLVRQQYNFSPPGTSFEREAWAVQVERATHLKLRITPDIGGGPSRATLTTLALS